MKLNNLIFISCLFLLISCASSHELETFEGSVWLADGKFENVLITGEALTEENSSAVILLHTDKALGKGYKVMIRNGEIDGSVKTGSLTSVRNLYRSLAQDNQWFKFEIAIRNDNITVRVNDTLVVNYTQPAVPFRVEQHSEMLLRIGSRIAIIGNEGKVAIRNLSLSRLEKSAVNDAALPPIDEANDHIIKYQQKDFPVIDFHVHLKGGLTKELAQDMSMNYGINYGVAPNAGEGGVGRMLADDNEVYEYFNEVKDMPFLRGVQGEGRKWIYTFSQEALGVFDYLFTDAMTIIDHKGRNSRIYRPEEVHYDGVSYQEYMEQIVNQTVTILTNEPADIFANPTFLPDELNVDYDKYWTDERVGRVLEVLEKNNIALEINARYRIPSLKIIQMAKDRGIRFTFGTNNVDADFGKLEYCFEAVEACNITADDLWFPSMSTRI